MYHLMQRRLSGLVSLPCGACGALAVHSAEPLCAACWGGIYLAADPKPISLSFTAEGSSWLPYGIPEVKRVMGALKFRGHDRLALQLGLAMSRDLPCPEVDVLVPVPLSPVRQYLRGYNQAERIAQGLHLGWGVPVATDLLHRRGWTSAKQSARTEAERQKIYGAYQARADPQWRGVRIALIDDTLTTGSTLNAAAEECIKKAKVAEVVPLTLAYATRRGR